MRKKPKASELSPDALEARRKYHREYARSYRKAKQPELKYRYGLTLEQRAELLASQGGVCAICAGEASEVDHCHKSGTVRGILCMPCNTALGSFKDSPERLLKAAEYLQRHDPRP